MKNILCIATLDTKGPEVKYLKEVIEKRGYLVLVVDVSSGGDPFFQPDIAATEVASAAGSTLEDIRNLKEAGSAQKIMTRGAIKIIKELYIQGKFSGVISVGGGMGTALGAAVIRELPFGLPKLIVSTQKLVQAGIKGYVGNKDVVVMPCVVDIAGLNRFVKKALSQAAGAITGMVELADPDPDVPERPMIFMTMNGVVTDCGLKVGSILEEKGYETVAFHVTGIGGMTFEDFIMDYSVKGVIDLALNEIGNELFGGMVSAGPHRLEAAGKKSIPQVIVPGTVDIINFLAPETVPEKYRERLMYFHNPQATVTQINAEELKLVAATIARKLNQAKGPVVVLIPSRGFSSLDREGSIFYDPKAGKVKVFVDSLKQNLKKSLQVKEIDAHINDEIFARIVCEEFLTLSG